MINNFISGRAIMGFCVLGLFLMYSDLGFITAFLPESVVTVIEKSIPTGESYNSKKSFDDATPEVFHNMTDCELQTISENLFKNDVNNAGKYVLVNYQGKAQSKSKVDFAEEPLLIVKDDVWNIPTISAMRALYDNYERNSKIEETVTSQELNEEIIFLDTVMATPLMGYLLSVLKNKGLVPNDYNDQREYLRNMWFELYPRSKGKLTSSGFEHIFLSEIKRGKISGLHNWLYFFTQEESKHANYLGYFNKIDLKENNSIIKMTFILDGIQKAVGSMFVAFSPELEMALYSLCFITRPNRRCPLSIAGQSFPIKTYILKHDGKNLIGSAFPDI